MKKLAKLVMMLVSCVAVPKVQGQTQEEAQMVLFQAAAFRGTVYEARLLQGERLSVSQVLTAETEQRRLNVLAKMTVAEGALTAGLLKDCGFCNSTSDLLIKIGLERIDAADGWRDAGAAALAKGDFETAYNYGLASISELCTASTNMDTARQWLDLSATNLEAARNVIVPYE